MQWDACFVGLLWEQASEHEVAQLRVKYNGMRALGASSGGSLWTRSRSATCKMRWDACLGGLLGEHVGEHEVDQLRTKYNATHALGGS